MSSLVESTPTAPDAEQAEQAGPIPAADTRQTMFSVYLRLGFEHLLDFRAYDHLLFLAVLCAPYPPARWRELLVLVTAFTVGHSVSLAFATLGWVRLDGDLVEYLILATIAATAAGNLVVAARAPSATALLPAGPASADPSSGRAGRALGSRSRWSLSRYVAAVVFGVVHGLGFSTFLRLALGAERSLFLPLLSFNVGLELAQVAAVGLLLALAFAATKVLRTPLRAWNATVSVTGGAWALALAASRLLFGV